MKFLHCYFIFILYKKKTKYIKWIYWNNYKNIKNINKWWKNGILKTDKGYYKKKKNITKNINKNITLTIEKKESIKWNRITKKTKWKLPSKERHCVKFVMKQNKLNIILLTKDIVYFKNTSSILLGCIQIFFDELFFEIVDPICVFYLFLFIIFIVSLLQTFFSNV